MKVIVSMALLAVSFASLAQSDSLRQCQLRTEKLREKLEQSQSELRMCQMNSGSSSEVIFLRNENIRLTNENRNLQIRIQELENQYRNPGLNYCAAACVNYQGTVDNRYLVSAVAPSQIEAEMLAKQETQKKYSCNYGVKTYKCEPIITEMQISFCSAACANYQGVADERYLAGGRGRNVSEAEVEAIKAVQGKYSCNYGVKVINCQ